MSVLKFVDVGFIMLHSTALGLNLLALYLISRIGLKEIDMWLGVIMASCDLLLSIYKLLQLPIVLLVDKGSFVFDLVVNIPISGIVIFVLNCSTVSVGYLGIIRWLVICHKRRPNELGWIMRAYLLHMTLFILTLLLCYCFNGFEMTPSGRFYCPDWRITNPWGFLASIVIIFNLIFSFVSFNGSYILITRQYLRQLAVISCSSQPYQHKPSSHRERCLIMAKIALMVILYNFTVLPPLITDSIEIITATPRTFTAGLISYSSIICIALVNPIVLITMHCETWRTFQNVFSNRRSRSHYPKLTEPDSSSTIDHINLQNIRALPSHP